MSINIFQIHRIFIEHILKEGLVSSVYRIWKLCRLTLLRVTHYWPVLYNRVKFYWSRENITLWMNSVRREELLITPEKVRSFVRWSDRHREQIDATKLRASKIRTGRILIFDQEYGFDMQDLPWHSDWRWNFTWSPKYFRMYDFHASQKEVPCDVKFPWELSRLSFLIPLAQMFCLTHDRCWLKSINDFVTHWEKSNPLAYSVNWIPMECSMRGANLCLVAQMLGSTQEVTSDDLAPLLRLITCHGEFIYRNIEYTKVRGNHYAANITALLFIGSTLFSTYRPSRRWIRYARNHLFSEISQQYCTDGVNFEKSIAYHRLVTELFLLSVLSLKKLGYTVPGNIVLRLQSACDYTACYSRPDGLSPNIGDNDGAWLLAFDSVPARDHRSLLALAAAYFSEAFFKAVAVNSSASIPLLLGNEGTSKWESLGSGKSSLPGVKHFVRGGMFVSSNNGNHLIADFGDVGMNGSGGHGHNDTFGFELSFDHTPFIIDPGSPTYTGDLSVYNTFRSTEYHNVLRVDRQEMARFGGTWKIKNEATPAGIIFESRNGTDSIQGIHYGYRRLRDGVVHKRKLIFRNHTGMFFCKDEIECTGNHYLERFLYFDPCVIVTLVDDGVVALTDTGRRVHISWDRSAQARLDHIKISQTYGNITESRRLVLENTIQGNRTIFFKIRLDPN